MRVITHSLTHTLTHTSNNGDAVDVFHVCSSQNMYRLFKEDPLEVPRATFCINCAPVQNLKQNRSKKKKPRKRLKENAFYLDKQRKKIVRLKSVLFNLLCFWILSESWQTNSKATHINASATQGGEEVTTRYADRTRGFGGGSVPPYNSSNASREWDG